MCVSESTPHPPLFCLLLKFLLLRVTFVVAPCLFVFTLLVIAKAIAQTLWPPTSIVGTQEDVGRGGARGQRGHGIVLLAIIELNSKI